MYHYLDHNATTPLHPRVVEAMAEHLRASAPGAAGFGNPSSIHAIGREARRAVEDARETLARLLRVDASELVFTGGGTEANNLAILGSAASGRLRGRHLVVSAFEHPAVLQSYRKLEREGWDVTFVNPDGEGLVSPEAVAAVLRPDTALVSVMAANNEVGSVQPVAAIGRLLRERGVLFHCDAVQALGKLGEVWPREWRADYAVFAAHKINGPKGIGVLYARKGAPLSGVTLGGSQERGFRGGTENVLGAVGFGKAAEVLFETGKKERAALAGLRDGLEAYLRRLPGLTVNGAAGARLPNTSHITLPGCRADLMVMGLDMRGVAASAGSACASGSVQHSHVLLAMGKDKRAAASSLRFSFGLGNREEEIPLVANLVAEVAESVRSP
jgi:cysteine desulfurase